MQTKYNINEKIYVIGQIAEISIDKDGVWYDVEIQTSSGKRSFPFKESALYPISEEENNGAET